MKPAEIASLDAAIAEAAARYLAEHELLTTGQLIELLLDGTSLLTATSDPGRRKQVDRALKSECAQGLRIERISGNFSPTGALGRPPQSAWRVPRDAADRRGE